MNRLAFTGWALLAFSADQWSKWAAARLLVEGPLPARPEHILSGTWAVTAHGLSLRLGGNRGGALGLGAGLPPVAHALVFGLATAAVVALAVILYRRSGPQRPGLAWGLALLVGGALGNLVDRIRLGYVVDFIQFGGQTWALPAFNLADLAIGVALGAVLLARASSAPGR